MPISIVDFVPIAHRSGSRARMSYEVFFFYRNRRSVSTRALIANAFPKKRGR